MRRFALAFFFALGIFWGLAPHLPAAPGAAGAPGLGAERAYLDAPGAGGGMAAKVLPSAAPFRARSWRRAAASAPAPTPPVRPARRRFLQLMRLQLEGG